ncbi:hypothetical protein BCT04_13050 [Vibrio breoganii]|uniref:Uncharacterized protein n=1 Tax=Vibrio breoganii TaxID=553239 RepID=A0AAP8MX79_9VIBR|nr:hypothetical protein BCV02_17380 [Vibrio breoganii]PMG05934.1 hypothetical protein BCV00_11520 [Vibrio breoganii]PMK34853.1 hypothetical protein BCU03_03515 [Vibrio breoganii]PML16582.1 hypothetical protein BCT84_20500 [Vibrio breoganii]PML32143.1 hypothetical protein BCT78_16265 [Vibrio breoganii]
MKLKRIYLSPKSALCYRAFTILLVAWCSYVAVDLLLNDFEQPQTTRTGVEINFYNYLFRYLVIAGAGIYTLLFVVRTKQK